MTSDGDCTCLPHPYGDGPERDCPVHGDDGPYADVPPGYYVTEDPDRGEVLVPIPVTKPAASDMTQRESRHDDPPTPETRSGSRGRKHAGQTHDRF